ncbi:sensor histidine kinase [Paenibacillus macerans]|uniref:sensor histidine kinase n=1 Tax=Paenibacillus macerans TaxID=44252 RepID=UPI003D317041
MAGWTRGRFRFKSIRTEIAVAFAGLMLCTTVGLTLNTLFLSSDAVKQSSGRYAEKLLEQVGANIAAYVGNMTGISEMALNNKDLQALMESGDPMGAEGREHAGRLHDFFRAVTESRNDIASILFIGSNGAVVSDRGGGKIKDAAELTGQDWYAAALEAGGREVVSSSRVQRLVHGEYRWVVSISRQIRGGGSGNGASGVLLVDLNYNVINDLGNSLQMGSRGYVFIVAPDGSLVYHPQQQLVYSGLKTEPIEAIMRSRDATFEAVNDSGARLYTVRNSAFGWKIVGVNDPEELVANKRQIQSSSFLWGGASLVLTLGLSLLLSLKLTEPIQNLGRQMKKMETGDFDVRVEITGVNEIGRLARTFNLMAAKIKQLVGQLVREQEEKRISELKALQAQIQPHFLYNTLDSIVWMAEMGKSAEVVKMTSALSKLLRASIGSGEELVPLRTELAQAENYLTIQMIRYRGQFTYSIDVDPELLDCLTIKLVMQPLVENAIYHGLRRKADPGHIAISGRRTASGIELGVRDDGLGMPPEQIERLSSMLRQPSEAARATTAFSSPGAMRPETQPGRGTGLARGCGGLGLVNVSHRVQLHFGRGYGLKVDSELDEGTTVVVSIPELNERSDADAGPNADLG